MESLKELKDNDRIRRILRGRMDYSFVTAYELLKDQKVKKIEPESELLKQNHQIMPTVNNNITRFQRKNPKEH